MSDTLLTRAELIVYAPSLASEPTASLDAYIEAASRAAERICDREFLTATVTERHPYGYSPRIWLKRPPATAVTSVKLISNSTPILMDDSGNVTGSSDERTDWTESRIERAVAYTIKNSQNFSMVTIDDEQIRVSSPEISNMYHYEVVYTGGFATTPATIKVAVAKMSIDIAEVFSGDTEKQSERIGDYAYSRFAPGTLFSTAGPVGALLSQYVWKGS